MTFKKLNFKIKCRDNTTLTKQGYLIGVTVLNYEFKVTLHKINRFWFASEFYTGLSFGVTAPTREQCVEDTIKRLERGNTAQYVSDMIKKLEHINTFA